MDENFSCYMTQKRVFLVLLLLLAVFLSSCSPGHVGSNEIAFVREGRLWTIDPDGGNSFEVIATGNPVIGYDWSPDHRIFAFRTLDDNFAKTSAGHSIKSDPITGLTKDVPSTSNTIGIDGGTAIPIVASSSDFQHSNAWWNPTGNRLLYREEATLTMQNVGTQTWWISQNDQPLDIARKLLPYTYSIPSMSINSMAIGNSSHGIFTTTLAGTQFQFIQKSALVGHPLPASLERVLWQPAHQNPSMLYAIDTDATKTRTFNTTALTMQLIVRNSLGNTRIIATCKCTQFAWSPDGNSILYSTATRYTIFNTKDFTTFSIAGEHSSVPYWSPDSRFIIFDGLHTLQIVNIADQRQQQLLNDLTSGSDTASSALPDAQTLLQPISNSIWAPDSRQFLFLTRGRLSWQGKKLVSGNGLYTVTINDKGQVQALPAVVDTGDDVQAGWTYEDPNTSFLF